MPRNIPIALQPSIATSHQALCYVMRVEPVSPGYPVYGVTSLDQPVTYDDGRGELTYSPSVGMVSSTFIAESELSVPEMDAESLFPEFDVPVNEADIVAGAYDFAKVDIYLVDYEHLDRGHVHIFRGTFGRITVNDRGLSFVQELRPLSQNLKQSITEKWSLMCRATFGSQPIGTGGGVAESRFPCNFDAEALWEGGEVDTVGLESNQSFTTSGLAPTYGGNPGKVRWLTGRNAGREYEVDTFEDDSGGQIIGLTFPTMFPIEAGDTFEFRDDCPKTKAACKARGNWANFRGEPNIPVGDAGQASVPGASAGIGTGGRLAVGNTDDPV